MSNVVRPAFVVSVPAQDGERFFIIRPETRLASAFPVWKSGKGWWEAVQQYYLAQTLLTESDLRTELAGMGLDADAVAEQIQRARRQRQFNELSSWDHITTIGFRNREGQEVVRKTGREGTSPEQRVFVLRCGVCGYEYGCDGCDIYDRLCPNCQDGSPGQST
jgi:hypothetical protein